MFYSYPSPSEVSDSQVQAELEALIDHEDTPELLERYKELIASESNEDPRTYAAWAYDPSEPF